MLSNQKRQAICIKVAQILREERLGKGVSMTRLAERAGVSQQMVSYIERGMRKPTLDVLLRISEALDIQLAAVLGQAYGLIGGALRNLKKAPAGSNPAQKSKPPQEWQSRARSATSRERWQNPLLGKKSNRAGGLRHFFFPRSKILNFPNRASKQNIIREHYILRINGLIIKEQLKTGVVPIGTRR